MAAIEVYNFAVTVATGSSPTAPVTTALPMPPRVIERIRIRFPPGCLGVVGIALGLAGQPIIPLLSGQYLVGDNEVYEEALENLPNSGAWQVFAYNEGNYPHTIQVKFDAALWADATTSAPATVIDTSAIYQAAAGAASPPLPAATAVDTSGLALVPLPTTTGTGTVPGAPVVPPVAAPPVVTVPVSPPAGTGASGTPPPPTTTSPVPPPVATPPDTGTTPPPLVGSGGGTAPAPPPPLPAAPPPIDWTTMVWFTATLQGKGSHGELYPTQPCATILVSSNVPGYNSVASVPVKLEGMQGILAGGRTGIVRCIPPYTDLTGTLGGDDEGPYSVGIVGVDGLPSVDRRLFGPLIGVKPIAALHTKPVKQPKSGG
jgi:hypothetical protein